MEELVRIFNGLDEAVWPPEVRAAWLHHAFVQIHPFQDGNGRVARGLASLVLIKAGLPAFTVTRDMRARYMRSLEAADRGMPQPLIDFFESAIYRQLVAVWRVLEVRRQEQDLRSASMSEIIAAAQSKLMGLHSLLPTAWSAANDSMQNLQVIADAKFGALVTELNASLRQVHSEFGAGYGHLIELRDAIGISNIEGWEPGPSMEGQRPISSSQLAIRSGTVAEISLRFDQLSDNRKGLIGAFVGITQDGLHDVIEPAFFINFKDAPRAVEFELWLEASIQKALLVWQSRLA